MERTKQNVKSLVPETFLANSRLISDSFLLCLHNHDFLSPCCHIGGWKNANCLTSDTVPSHTNGYPRCGESYLGFAFNDTALVPTPIENSYQALEAGECDILVGFTTDSMIAEQNLVSLSDDLPFFPVYNPAPLLRHQAYEIMQAKAPGVINQLACISQALDNATTVILNH